MEQSRTRDHSCDEGPAPALRRSLSLSGLLCPPLQSVRLGLDENIRNQICAALPFQSPSHPCVLGFVPISRIEKLRFIVAMPLPQISQWQICGPGFLLQTPGAQMVVCPTTCLEGAGEAVEGEQGLWEPRAAAAQVSCLSAAPYVTLERTLGEHTLFLQVLLGPH